MPMYPSKRVDILEVANSSFVPNTDLHRSPAKVWLCRVAARLFGLSCQLSHTRYRQKAIQTLNSWLIMQISAVERDLRKIAQLLTLTTRDCSDTKADKKGRTSWGKTSKACLIKYKSYEIVTRSYCKKH